MAGQQAASTATTPTATTGTTASGGAETYSLNNLYLAQTRVYIAGVLMPTVNVTITCQFNQPPRASIALPVYPELFYIGDMDRVPVHVFVQETMVQSGEFLLLFEGFIVSNSYFNNPVQRTIHVECVSHLDILNDVQLKFLSTITDAFMQELPGQQAQAAGVRLPGIIFPAALFYQGLGTDPDAKPIRFPSDYLENLYSFIQKADITDDVPMPGFHDSILGVYYGEYARSLKLLDRFVRLPYFDQRGHDFRKAVQTPGSAGIYAWEVSEYPVEDDDAATMFPMLYGMQTSAVMQRLCQSASGPAKASMMALLQYLVEEMEYEFLFITNPAYHGKPAKKLQDAMKTEKKDPEKPGAAASGGKSTGDPAQAAQQQPSAQGEVSKQTSEAQVPEEFRTPKLVSSCLKPLLVDAIPPQCNIMYRTLVSSVQLHTQFKGIPTRVLARDLHGPLAINTREIPEFLKYIGVIDYYPSNIEEHQQFEPTAEEKENGWLRRISQEILSSEEFTGPWVQDVRYPPWFKYLKPYSATVTDPQGEEHSSGKAFKERFLRRQLMSFKYLPRTVQTQGAFDPYVTPGFPGVVFDGGDTGLAFAGHVVAVEHTISKGEMSTRVSMNFVRPLMEATALEIPNALNSIQVVTHNSAAMTEVYQAILGTPSTSIEGAQAVTFGELYELLDSSRENVWEENTDPLAAYRSKRRNIVTFEDYCSFMGFTYTTGNGPEGPNTPLLLNGEFLEHRRDIELYSELLAALKKKDPHAERSVHRKEKVVPNPAVRDPEPLKVKPAVPTAPQNPDDPAAKNEDPQVKKEEKAEDFKLITKVRSILQKVAQLEFSKVVYK